jgi:oxalate decarboxylase
MNQTPSTHRLKFSQMAPQEKTAAGMRIRANKDNFPALKDMSLYKVILMPNGMREPHWHANADELGYCLSGQIMVHLYHTSDTKASFLVQPGEAFLIPSGALHDIENVGEGQAEAILCFSSDSTEDFNLSTTMSMFSNAVLGNTWQVDAKVFESFKRSSTSVFAASLPAPATIPPEARYETPYRFALEASEPLVTSSSGSARMAKQNVWPIVTRQALYSLILTNTGMREPHWHPETAELGYVHKGKGRMSILSPSGKVDTYEMDEGDIYFIPKAYPHHIENLSQENLHLLIFFDQPMPEDIGFTGSVRSFSNNTLGAATNNDPAFFEQLAKYYDDLFIVDRINVLDK